MTVYTDRAQSGNRPAFVDAFPSDKAAHDKARKAMFGAANKAGLSSSEFARDARIENINALLGLRLQSVRQATVTELQAVTVAIETGAFRAPNWHLKPGFQAQVHLTETVQFDNSEERYEAAIRAAFTSSPRWLESLLEAEAPELLRLIQSR